MPYFVYLLSNPASQIYIGQTKNLERRLTEHNNPEYRGSVHTKRRPGPWKLVYSERCATRSAAMRRERALKSAKGREWLRGELENPAKHGGNSNAR